MLNQACVEIDLIRYHAGLTLKTDMVVYWGKISVVKHMYEGE